jgi:hypothetical protein
MVVIDLIKTPFYIPFYHPLSRCFVAHLIENVLYRILATSFGSKSMTASMEVILTDWFYRLSDDFLIDTVRECGDS